MFNGTVSFCGKRLTGISGRMRKNKLSKLGKKQGKQNISRVRKNTGIQVRILLMGKNGRTIAILGGIGWGE